MMNNRQEAQAIKIPNITPASEGATLSHKDYVFIRDLAFEKTGINLNENKVTMIQSRISRRLNALKLRSYSDYIEYLQNNPQEMTPFINSLTTNKTDFFREIDHFDYLRDNYFPNLTSNSTGKSLYVWSAACSAGHEVYTLGMVFDEFTKSNPSYDFRILGTDIDTDILTKAENGIYPAEQVSPIAPNYLRGNFEKGRGNDDGNYIVTKKLKEKIKFRQFNLIDPANTVPLQFDIIFLRNVLIYFTKDTIQIVIDKLVSHLNPGGLLFIGHSETLNGINHNLQSLGSAIYKKPEE